MVQLLEKETEKQLNAANCRINFNYNQVVVTDLQGNTDTIFVTYKMENDLHTLLKKWIDEQ